MNRMGTLLRALLMLAGSAIVLATATTAQAAPGEEADSLFGRPIALVIALALVSLAPFVFMSVTAFVKISTVLQIVRGAIGAQNVPSNTVVMALAAALTMVAMAPVGSRIMNRAAPVLAAPSSKDTSALATGLIEAAREPMRAFLRANATEADRHRFYEATRLARPPEERDAVGKDDLMVLVPSFIVTELTEAFAVGFMVYLPFLVIDLVVSNVLLALGMQMLNPTQMSLPFKLLLFVSIDGWGLLARTLVTGYAAG